MTLTRSGWAALVLVLLLAACERDTGDDANANEVADSEESSDEEAAPIPVETTAPIRGNIYATYSGTAPIEAFAEADVVAKVEGEIRSLHVEEGDSVRKDQVLATLDGDRLRLELSESGARLQKLKRDFERNKELQNRGLISEGDFERIQYDLESLQASYNLANLELDYTQIRAPIDGVISERYVKLGNTIKIGDPVYRVTSLNPLVAYLYAPEREFRRLSAGQAVRISVDALPDSVFDAKVTRVSPIVDPDTGTFKITIEMNDTDGRIKPGMFGRMNIVYDMHENVLQVPRSAIVDRAGELSVFVVENNIGIRKIIETGFSSEGMVEVGSGLTDGDSVITVGQIGLKNESKVVVVNLPSTDSE